MLRVGFEPTIPAFERAKTLHALDLAATVIGNIFNTYYLFTLNKHPLNCICLRLVFTYYGANHCVSYITVEDVRQD
jgi:hypothetical protein